MYWKSNSNILNDISTYRSNNLLYSFIIFMKIHYWYQIIMPKEVICAKSHYFKKIIVWAFRNIALIFIPLLFGNNNWQLIGQLVTQIQSIWANKTLAKLFMKLFTYCESKVGIIKWLFYQVFQIEGRRKNTNLILKSMQIFH